jgi:hypothetical protein
MRTRSLTARSAKIFAVPLLLAGVAAATAPATPAAATTARTHQLRAIVRVLARHRRCEHFPAACT